MPNEAVSGPFEPRGRVTVVSALSDVAFTFAKYEPQLADNNEQGATREEKRVNVERRH